MRLRLMTLLALGALLAFGFAACGGDDEAEPVETEEVEREPSPGSDVEPEPDEVGDGEVVRAEGGSVTVDAAPDGNLDFVQSEIRAASGTLTVTLVNSSAVPHDFTLEQDGRTIGRTDVISDGAEDSHQFDLQAGEYQFYCSVGGHRAAGMEGTLIVE